MKRLTLSIFLGLLAFFLAIGILPQGEAQAGFEVRTPVVTGPLTLNPLASQVITASGFENGESITLSIGGKTASQGESNTSGVYTAAVSPAQDLPYGAVAVLAVAGERSDAYTATIVPGITTSKVSGNAGSSFRVSGNGFGASEAYTVTFTDQTDALQANCVATTATVTNALIITGTTTAWGSFSKEAAVPAVADGTYYFAAIGQSSNTCAVTE